MTGGDWLCRGSMVLLMVLRIAQSLILVMLISPAITLLVIARNMEIVPGLLSLMNQAKNYHYSRC
ncbi:MAG: hypothetical protein EHJ95_08335 [Methanobacteriota archaeon]|nr:MAG: hypothetical protein EHJ95_08335 [Euryarchaeota archaeon]